MEKKGFAHIKLETGKIEKSGFGILLKTIIGPYKLG